MHVKRMRSLLVASYSLAMFGCDAPSAQRPVVVRSPPAASDASVAADMARASDAALSIDEAELVRLGRRARDAATTVAKRCSVYSPSIASNLGFFWLQDTCRSPLDAGDELGDALLAFRPAAERAGGAAATFAIEVALFADYVKLAARNDGIGTLAHYQDVARFWNNWRKDETTKLDPVEIANEDVARVNGVAKWERCGSAPCLRVHQR